MTPKAPALLLAAILALALVAIVFIAWDTCVTNQHAERGREFQRLVRGLGLGPAVTLSPCEFSFDARVFPDWRTAHHPIACGEFFCPGHASSVFYLAPLERAADLFSEAPSDAGIR
jgi:hypothetical protein